MSKSNLVVISGASGVGKGTVIKALLAKNPHMLSRIATATTRPKRPGEVDGKDHFFINEAEFQTQLVHGDFIEHFSYDGHRYGTSRKALELALAQGKKVILEIDVRGAEVVKKIFPDAILIFITPPSFDELERRLRGRHTEAQADIEDRLKRAFQEMQLGPKLFDHQVINPTGHPEQAVTAIEKIILE